MCKFTGLTFNMSNIQHFISRTLAGSQTESNSDPPSSSPHTAILSLNFITLESHVSGIVEYLLFCVGMGSPSIPLCCVYVVHRPEVHSLSSLAICMCLPMFSTHIDRYLGCFIGCFNIVISTSMPVYQYLF